MPIQTTEHDVAGRRVAVTTMPAGVGLAVGRRLLKLAGTALVEGIGGGPASLLAADWGAVSRALRELVERASEPEAESLVKDLCRGVTVDGEDAHKHFDLVFAADYALLFRVVALVIEENFRLPLASWSAAVRGAVVEARAKEAARKAADQPPTRVPRSARALAAT